MVLSAETLSSGRRRVMGVSKLGASRAIQDLEREFGVRLFRRTTRRLSLTDRGRKYFDAVRGALAHPEEAGLAMRGSVGAPRGVVRLTTADAGRNDADANL